MLPEAEPTATTIPNPVKPVFRLIAQSYYLQRHAYLTIYPASIIRVPTFPLPLSHNSILSTAQCAIRP